MMLCASGVRFAELTELFKDHKFVGCVDQTKILVQFLVSFTVYTYTHYHVYCIFGFVQLCKEIDVHVSMLEIHMGG